MNRYAIAAGASLLAAAWALAASSTSLTAHMVAHMTAVALAAPLLALGFAGTVLDVAARWRSALAPVSASLVELAVVWGWHLPAARELASTSAVGLVLEQASFCGAGWLLWSACLGARQRSDGARRAAAVAALLLTTMHMTLLGALIALAPRPLFASHHSAVHAGAAAALADQQLAGVVMLLVGGGSYLCGGLWLLAGLLRGDGTRVARWS
jgi:putative membrane protein